ncbi:MAG: lamin tail domain-containing protein [Clostridiales bacterium]|jgi:hypothetical protein|nr:lamin tail domain-containing protein [Clostridiales bacterium]
MQIERILKKVVSLLLVLAISVLGSGLAAPAYAADPPDHVLISQKSGIKNTSDTISHNFIELYNPTGQNAVMDGWSLEYGGGTSGAIDLSGYSIPAHGYFFHQRQERLC